jgi:hypothetical protein
MISKIVSKGAREIPTTRSCEISPAGSKLDSDSFLLFPLLLGCDMTRRRALLRTSCGSALRMLVVCFSTVD